MVSARRDQAPRQRRVRVAERSRMGLRVHQVVRYRFRRPMVEEREQNAKEDPLTRAAQRPSHESDVADGGDEFAATVAAGFGHGHASHGHSAHGHGHGFPVTAPSSINGAFAISVGLNIAFVAVEGIYGVIAKSTALIADAAHNLSDVLGLLLAWGAAWLAHRQPSKTRTYGFRKSTVLASLANATLLLLAIGAVVWEAIGRFFEPQAVTGQTVMVVALVGVLINAGSALLFARSSKNDLNLRGAFLHLVADAAVSAAVVVAGALLIWRPSWVWLDPAVSIAVSLVVLWSAWRLMSAALHLSLDGVPRHLDVEHVRGELERLPGVLQVADLHIWALSTSESALTAHLVVSEEAPADLAQKATAVAHAQFEIGHCTIQLDPAAGAEPCDHC